MRALSTAERRNNWKCVFRRLQSETPLTWCSATECFTAGKLAATTKTGSMIVERRVRWTTSDDDEQSWDADGPRHQGSFREGERVGTPFPLLKCLRTYYGRHCEPFSDQKCTRLQDFFIHNLKIFSGGNTLCYCFTKRPLLDIIRL